jgi:hypothetical protein
VLTGGDVPGIGSFEWLGDDWHEIGAVDDAPDRVDAAGFSSIDGAGTVVFAGVDRSSNATGDWWTLRWEGGIDQACTTGFDTDGNGVAGCADPGCWALCSPTCPPGTTCPADAPRCGDGTCSASETCRSCPSDCACTPTCGDLICDPGETDCPGDCP